jgi:quinol monooxygenase YgiN
MTLTKQSIVVTMNLRGAPGHKAEGEALMHRFAQEVRQDPGCLRFEILIDENDDSELLFLTEWESAEALQNHFQKGYSDEFQRRGLSFLATTPTIRSYHRLV